MAEETMSESSLVNNIQEYIKTLTTHRPGHFSAGDGFCIIKLLFVDFQLRHHHRLHGEQEGGATYLELGPNGFDLVIETKQLVGQAMHEGNAQLVKCPRGTIAFHSRHCELVCQATSVRAQDVRTIWSTGMMIRSPVKLAFAFTLRRDGADSFRTMKKLVCFV